MEDLNQTATKKDLKELEGNIDLKIGGLQHDMDGINKKIDSIDETVNRVYNLMEPHG